MHIKQGPDRMILQDSPGGLWIFGSFFVFVGSIFVYGSFGGFANYDEVPRWAVLLTFFMGAIAVTAGIWQIYTYPLSKVFLDKVSRTIVLKRRGLFEKTETVYSFDEAERFFAAQSEDDEGNPIWRIELELRNEEKIKITNVWQRDRNACEQITASANNFLKS